MFPEDNQNNCSVFTHTHARTHAHTHAGTQTHTHGHTHGQRHKTHKHTHTHTRTHTHSYNKKLKYRLNPECISMKTFLFQKINSLSRPHIRRFCRAITLSGDKSLDVSYRPDFIAVGGKNRRRARVWHVRLFLPIRSTDSKIA